MRLMDYTIKCSSRSDSFRIYPIGDLHLGARDCAETHFRRLVTKIKNDPNAYWIGGGDLCECIKPDDVKRWEFDNLPDWLLEGKPDDIRENMTDVVFQQKKRLVSILEPIKAKCIGLVSGNHEDKLKKTHNQDFHGYICKDLDAEDLTSEAFIRLKFNHAGAIRQVHLFITHGHGGGRGIGSEPNHLFQLATMWNADVILRGHSHTFCILEPLVQLGLPNSGQIPDELLEFQKRAGNWGCWRKSYAAGASTYTSRACYRPRPLNTIEIEIWPHQHKTDSKPERPKIAMKELVL